MVKDSASTAGAQVLAQELRSRKPRNPAEAGFYIKHFPHFFLILIYSIKYRYLLSNFLRAVKVSPFLSKYTVSFSFYHRDLYPSITDECEAYGI